MITDLIFRDYAARLGEFIRAQDANNAQLTATSEAAEDHFNRLALELFAIQFSANDPYRRLCQAQKVSPATVSAWTQIPAVPTVAFKELELTSLPPSERTTVFHSSGTTEQRPSQHFHNDESLALYEASLLPWFKTHLAPEVAAMTMVFLTPSPALAPHSSLAHMFENVRQAFGTAESIFTGEVDSGGDWKLNGERTCADLRQRLAVDRPVTILGTAFNFVHLLDHLAERNLHLRLPAGSRVLETGGYKGRSRSLPKSELHAIITKHLGIPPSHIVCEYGMSELSSQAYDRVAGGFLSSEFQISSCERLFRFPPWARAQIVSPETGREVGEGETGLIRIFDLANVRSVMAIQTEDLGIRRRGGFELIGRVPQAEPRGCSLMTA